MKKLLLTILSFALVMGVAVSGQAQESQLDKTFMGSVVVYTDKETGVQYLIFADGSLIYRGYGISVVPRLNKYGNVVVVKNQND